MLQAIVVRCLQSLASACNVAYICHKAHSRVAQVLTATLQTQRWRTVVLLSFCHTCRYLIVILPCVEIMSSCALRGPLAMLAALLACHAPAALAQPTFTDVRNGRQLQAAVADGATHIRLRSHIDLRGLPMTSLCPGSSACVQQVYMMVQSGTLSITVCSHFAGIATIIAFVPAFLCVESLNIVYRCQTVWAAVCTLRFDL